MYIEVNWTKEVLRGLVILKNRCIVVESAVTSDVGGWTCCFTFNFRFFCSDQTWMDTCHHSSRRWRTIRSSVTTTPWWWTKVRRTASTWMFSYPTSPTYGLACADLWGRRCRRSRRNLRTRLTATPVATVPSRQLRLTKSTPTCTARPRKPETAFISSTRRRPSNSPMCPCFSSWILSWTPDPSLAWIPTMSFAHRCQRTVAFIHHPVTFTRRDRCVIWAMADTLPSSILRRERPIYRPPLRIQNPAVQTGGKNSYRTCRHLRRTLPAWRRKWQVLPQARGQLHLSKHK